MKDWVTLKSWYKQFLRIVKPWKIRLDGDKSVQYVLGYNQALKDIQKNADNFFIRCDKDLL